MYLPQGILIFNMFNEIIFMVLNAYDSKVIRGKGEAHVALY